MKNLTLQAAVSHALHLHMTKSDIVRIKEVYKYTISGLITHTSEQYSHRMNQRSYDPQHQSPFHIPQHHSSLHQKSHALIAVTSPRKHPP